MRGASLGALWSRARRRPVRWALTIVLAAITGLTTASMVEGAGRERARWGASTSVAVATRDLAPGAVIGIDDVVVAPRPQTMVPDDALTDVVGRVVAARIATSEAVLDRRLAGGTGPLALLEAGAVAFAVPVDTSTPPLRPGDRVDVFAPVDSGSRSAVGATRIARRAVVVAVDDRTVLLGVESASASVVARALLDTAVVLAVVA